MRKVALTVAFLSATTVIAGCGDDYPSNLDATIVYVGPDGGNVGEGGILPDAGCPSATFITPAPAAKLTAADDKDNDSCAAGFQIDVKLAVGAPDGTAVTLLANNTPVGTPGVVSGGTVTITGVSLGTQGASALVAQIGAGAACTVSNPVTVDCTAVSCNITKPVISEAHPSLNDIPVAEGGDRVNSAGSDYQAAFEVTTNAPDGSDVELRVSKAGQPPGEPVVVNSKKVAMGKATFPGVTLRPDGVFNIQATCIAPTGRGLSQSGNYTVDTQAPDLTVVSPVMGQFFGPSDLVNGKFKVCASTTASDAAGLGMALPRMGKNLGAGIGSSLEFVAVPPAAVGSTGGSACVDVTCNGGAPFDVNVSLYDQAGNKTTKVVQGVRCASTLPSVLVLSPSGDVDPYADLSKRLLASNADQILKDLDPTKPGAQTNVVACTDKAGAKAVLKSAVQGSAATIVGTEVTVTAAEASDGCSLGFVAKWSGVTLPDSSETNAGALQSPTELVVEVTDVSTATGVSSPVRLWVDSQPPTLVELTPSPLCGKIFESAVDVTTPIRLVSTTNNVELKVVGPNETKTYPVLSQVGATVDFGTVGFTRGDSEVAAVAIEPAGNKSVLPSPCTVRVGEIPIVNFVSPGSGANLCAFGTVSNCVADADEATPGWQGEISVSVAVAGQPASSGDVTFSINGVDVGTSSISAGAAKLSNVTIQDAAPVVIKATTSDLSGTGSGSASKSLVVDTTKPGAVTDLGAVVKSRRQTSFFLSWKAAADGTARAAGYQIKVSPTAIIDATFAAAESVSFSGQPAAAGQVDGLDVLGRRIATDYFFAVAAVDAVGNRGPISFSASARADFLTTVLDPPATPVTNERFGNSIDGSEDLDGDGKSDLLIGSISGQRAYIYFGAANPSDLADPSKRKVTVLNGLASTAFGRSFINIGDIDGDQKNDIAISASLAGGSRGRVYIFKGRAQWNGSYDVETQADYIIEMSSATYVNSRFGESMARIGNFDGDPDGTDDLAIGAFGYGTNRGRVVIVLGKKGTFSASNPDLITIDGDPAQPTGKFGERLTGLGNYYSGQGTTLVVSATGTNSNAGTVYTFQGLSAQTSYTTAAAKHFQTAPGGGLYGYALAPTGLGGTGAGLAVGGDTNLTGLGDGFFDLWLGTQQAGPFAGANVRFGSSTASAGADDLGRLVFGSVFSGSSVGGSIVGDSTPDVVVVPFREGGLASSIHVLDGAGLTSLTSPVNVATQAVVKIPLPTDWQQVALYQRTGAVRDIDGDGFSDIAIGEYSTGISPSPTIPGRIFLVW